MTTFDPEAIRKDFPCLDQMIKGKSPVYFDNACMTLKPRQVVEAMNEYYYRHPGCHNRAVHAFGEMTTARYTRARKKVADFLNANSPEQIVFTRNTTEGINLVARSFPFKTRNVILTTDMEHNSNLLPWQALVREKGVVHDLLPLNRDFSFDFDGFKQKLQRGVTLVSLFHTSHVTGHSLPVDDIVREAHAHDALVLLDCAQSASHVPLDVRQLDPDFVVFSFHKMLGPTGMGALYVKQALVEKLEPFLVGGETITDADYHTCVFAPFPERFEAGLQNYAGVMGTEAALEYLEACGLTAIHEHQVSLNRIISEGITELPRIRIIGPKDPLRRGGIVNFLVEGMDSGELSIILNQTGVIMTRSGIHCCHSWYRKEDLPPSLRASVHLYNTRAEAELFVQTIKDIASYF